MTMMSNSSMGKWSNKTSNMSHKNMSMAMMKQKSNNMTNAQKMQWISKNFASYPEGPRKQMMRKFMMDYKNNMTKMSNSTMTPTNKNMSIVMMRKKKMMSMTNDQKMQWINKNFKN